MNFVMSPWIIVANLFFGVLVLLTIIHPAQYVLAGTNLVIAGFGILTHLLNKKAPD